MEAKRRGSGLTGAGRPLLARFGQIYVINLPERRDRRTEMSAELARIGIGAGAPEVTWFDAVRPADKGDFRTLGARGCFESHLGVLRRIAAGPHESALLLEDDADFAPGLARALDALEGESWDMVFGLYTGRPEAGRPGPSGLIEVPPQEGLLLAHFVGVRRDVAQRLVPYLEAMLRRPGGDPSGGPMDVDGAYSWFRAAHPDVRTLCPAEPMAVQRPSRSDIHTLRLMDRLPLLRAPLGWLRRIKRRLRARAA